MTDKRHFAALDGLRGLAALAVMLRHLSEEFRLPQIVAHGYLAVDFFFALSGFVVCWAYERRLQTDLSRAQFLTLRAVRLFPLIVLGSLIGGVVALRQGQSPGFAVQATILSMLALPFPWRALLFPINSPLWSMFYEVLSNIAYVVARPFASTRSLALLTGVAGVILAGVGLKIGNLDVGFALDHWWAGAPRLAYPFLVGMLIYRVRERGEATPGLPPWALALMMTVVFLLPASGPRHLRALIDLSCTLLLLPALVWLGLRSRVGVRWAAACALAGEISYPLYVIHKPLEAVMAQPVLAWSRWGRMGAAATCAVIIVGLAWLAYRRYDIPVRRWITAALKPASGRSQSPPASDAALSS